MKKSNKFLLKNLLFMLLLAVISSCKSGDASAQTPEETVDETNELNRPGTMRAISSKQLVAEMGLGWNLGNSFDVENRDKTAWGNPLPTKAMIDFIAAAGFKTLRIPVTWDYHTLKEAPYTIESDYLDRVQKVVNYGLENQMHVILNTHHEDPWIIPLLSKEDEVLPRLEAIWFQIAQRFQDYGDKLIFETLNEPRYEGSPEEWTGGTQEGRESVNRYHKTALDAIRATGVNNVQRHVMISSYAASTTDAAMNGLEIPNEDPNVIISLHTYFPWTFAGQPVDDGGVSTWGTDPEKAALTAEMERIYQKWVVENDHPVILGEWGTINKENLITRVAYHDFYTKAALAKGFVPIVWDDGGNFGLFDRHELKWRFPEIAQAILDAAAK